MVRFKIGILSGSVSVKLLTRSLTDDVITIMRPSRCQGWIILTLTKRCQELMIQMRLMWSNSDLPGLKTSCAAHLLNCLRIHACLSFYIYFPINIVSKIFKLSMLGTRSQIPKIVWFSSADCVSRGNLCRVQYRMETSLVLKYCVTP